MARKNYWYSAIFVQFFAEINPKQNPMYL